MHSAVPSTTLTAAESLPPAPHEPASGPDTLTPWLPAAAQPTAELAPGDLVDGSYRIKRLLGKGGMGQVWEAVDEILWRPVALKTAFDASGVSCLIQEGQALAALRHPVVPAVYALAHHGPASVLVMERVSGKTLEQLLEERRTRCEMLPLAEALRILCALAAGLDVIHAAGISHRDLKPANIMLASQGRVVLLDFGVFQPECAPPPAEVTGTPFYIAPETVLEQVLPGQAFLTDLYSFGVVAFEVLTLRTPYAGKSLIDLFTQHVHAEIPRLRGLRPEAPAALESLLEELLAKSPLDRPAGAAEVLARLQRSQSGSASRVMP